MGFCLFSRGFCLLPEYLSESCLGFCMVLSEFLTGFLSILPAAGLFVWVLPGVLLLLSWFCLVSADVSAWGLLGVYQGLSLASFFVLAWVLSDLYMTWVFTWATPGFCLGYTRVSAWILSKFSLGSARISA